MKKKINDHHPVDAFFQQQEKQIPVEYNPANWEALQKQLAQKPAGANAAPDKDTPPPKAAPWKFYFFGFVILAGLCFLGFRNWEPDHLNVTSESEKVEMQNDEMSYQAKPNSATDQAANAMDNDAASLNLSISDKSMEDSERTLEVRNRMMDIAPLAEQSLPEMLQSITDTISIKRFENGPRNMKDNTNKEVFIFW